MLVPEGDTLLGGRTVCPSVKCPRGTLCASVECLRVGGGGRCTSVESQGGHNYGAILPHGTGTFSDRIIIIIIIAT